MRTVVVLGAGAALGAVLLLTGCGGGDGTPTAAGPGSSSVSVSVSPSVTGPSASPSGDAFGPSGTASGPSGTASGPSGTASGAAGPTGSAVDGAPGAGSRTSPTAASPSASRKSVGTAAWTKAANAACADYATVLGPGGGSSAPAMVQSRLRDRAWSITGRLRGLPAGSSRTESFITLLFGVGEESDWLIQQYLNPTVDTKTRTIKEQARDARLAQWYDQAAELGTGRCADLMKAA